MDTTMMVWRFQKDRAEEVLACIRDGKPIPSPAAGWDILDMMQVAGVLIFSAGTHPNPATKEAIEVKDLLAIAAAHMEFSESVLDDTYDADFEQEVSGTAEMGEKGPVIRIGLGARSKPENDQ